MNNLLTVLFLALFLGGCVSSTPNNGYSSGFNEDQEEVYADDTITSDNWTCSDDCSGHEAGYDWANEKGITDPSDCGGNSDSFIEGCEAYANEYND